MNVKCFWGHLGEPDFGLGGVVLGRKLEQDLLTGRMQMRTLSFFIAGNEEDYRTSARD